MVGNEMVARGQALQGGRLDSGDLRSLSWEVRRVLDDAGLPEVRIVASGGLDEVNLHELVSGGAPIDAFGVGTRMGVSADAPWTDMAYKLGRYGGPACAQAEHGQGLAPRREAGIQAARQIREARRGCDRPAQ